jgi:hypothetical protein
MAAKPLLQLQLTFKGLLVFMFFFLFMHEMHELAHIFAGRVICGCWGTRDFNVWDLCKDCTNVNPLSVWATFAGPLFTFVMLWIGWCLLKYAKSPTCRSLGIVFILGNMQFGRIYMAGMGQGDEIWGFRSIFLNQNHSNFEIIRIITFLIVVIICLPPLIAAYKAIANKRKILIYISFLIVPLIFDTAIILILLNGILEKGVLSQVWIMGTPLLITIWFVVCLLVIITNFSSLTHFADDITG